jgi:hypothetical protein
MSRFVRWLLSTLALASLCLAGAAAAGEARRALRFDPFERPDLDTIARAADPSDARPSDDEWAPVLSATLDSGAESLANLGGVVLKIGEETHGYRLKEVRLWEAVFDRNGVSVVLAVETPAAMAEAP